MRRAARENGPFRLMALEETREVEGRSFFFIFPLSLSLSLRRSETVCVDWISKMG